MVESDSELLRETVTRLTNALEERDKELSLAATYGQQLINENLTLRNRLQSYKDRQKSSRSPSPNYSSTVPSKRATTDTQAKEAINGNAGIEFAASRSSDTAYLLRTANLTSPKKVQASFCDNVEYYNALETQVQTLQGTVAKLEAELRNAVTAHKKDVELLETSNADLKAKFYAEEREKNKLILLKQALKRQLVVLKRPKKNCLDQSSSALGDAVEAEAPPIKASALKRALIAPTESPQGDSVKNNSATRDSAPVRDAVESLLYQSALPFTDSFAESGDSDSGRETFLAALERDEICIAEDTPTLFAAGFAEHSTAGEALQVPTLYQQSSFASVVDSDYHSELQAESNVTKPLGSKTSVIIKTLFYHWFQNFYRLLPIPSVSREYADWTTRGVLYASYRQAAPKT